MKRYLATALPVALVVALATAPADAQNKKKKKNRPTQQPQAAAAAGPSLVEVDAALRAWDLERAGNLLAKAEASPAVKVRQAQLVGQRGNLGGAHDQLAQVTQSQPGNAAAWNALGEVRIAREQLDAADAAFRRAETAALEATKANGKDGDAWLQLGIARQRLKKYDAAAEALRTARQNEADETEVRFQLGRTFAFKQDWQAAVDMLNVAIERQKSLAEAYFYRAVAFRRLDQNGRMVEDLERFLALAPNAPDAERARRLLQAARG